MKLHLVSVVVLSLSLPGLTLAQSTKHSPKVAKTAWCQTSTTSCFVAKSGQSWETAFPDATERDIIRRINHTNSNLYPGRMIMVPTYISSNALDYSPLPRNIEAPNEKLIIVDPQKHAWGAYDPYGALVHWGPATGGATKCPDMNRGCRTKSGEFRVYSLGSAACKSSKFPLGKGGAPMPYCMFFHGGQALHGSPGGVMKGNASHGCVRLFVEDAKWLRYNFVDGPSKESKYRGTRVIVMPYGG